MHAVLKAKTAPACIEQHFDLTIPSEFTVFNGHSVRRRSLHEISTCPFPCPIASNRFLLENTNIFQESFNRTFCFNYCIDFFPTEILENADLSKTTSKSVRLTLEKKLNCELLARKKEIDDLVMDFAQSQASDNDNAESEEETKPPKKAAAPKKRKQASSDDDDKSSDDSDSDASYKKKKKPAAKKAKAAGEASKPKGKGNGFTRPYKLSPDLAAVVGADALPRHEVVKKVWAIIKSRNLYDPKNKQFAICDAELQKVMGVKRFRTFGMLKYLKNHFIYD